MINSRLVGRDLELVIILTASAARNQEEQRSSRVGIGQVAGIASSLTWRSGVV